MTTKSRTTEADRIASAVVPKQAHEPSALVPAWLAVLVIALLVAVIGTGLFLVLAVTSGEPDYSAALFGETPSLIELGQGGEGEKVLPQTLAVSPGHALGGLKRLGVTP